MLNLCWKGFVCCGQEEGDEGLFGCFGFQAVDSAVEGQHIEFFVGVFAKSRNASARFGIGRHFGHCAKVGNFSMLESKPPKTSRYEVSIKVDSVKIGETAASIDVSAGDAGSRTVRKGGLIVVLRGVGVFHHGGNCVYRL